MFDIISPDLGLHGVLWMRDLRHFAHVCVYVRQLFFLCSAQTFHSMMNLNINSLRRKCLLWWSSSEMPIIRFFLSLVILSLFRPHAHTHDHVISLFSSLDYAFLSDSYHELTSKLVLTLDSFNIKLALIMILCYFALLSWWKLPDSDRILFLPTEYYAVINVTNTIQCLLHIYFFLYFVLFSIFLEHYATVERFTFNSWMGNFLMRSRRTDWNITIIMYSTWLCAMWMCLVCLLHQMAQNLKDQHYNKC